MRTVLFSIFLFSIFCFPYSSAQADTVSAKRLIENAKIYDGKNITYTGEATTAVMKRGEYGWVNVHDGTYAIGVWCKTGDLDRIKIVGDYKYKGDIVRIDGIFHRACPMHGGELDIHADTLTVVNHGFRVNESVDRDKLRLTVYIFLAVLLIVIVFRKRL